MWKYHQNDSSLASYINSNNFHIFDVFETKRSYLFSSRYPFIASFQIPYYLLKDENMEKELSKDEALKLACTFAESKYYEQVAWLLKIIG